MPSLQIQLLGELSIRDGEGRQVLLTPPRAQELFCYLVLNRGRPLAREALLDTFWQHSSAAQARRNLRQTLWQLQAALSAQRQPSAEKLICSSALWVSLSPEAPMQSDVAAFMQAFEPVRGLSGEQMDEPQADSLRRAVALYRGDLLEGWYCEWCLAERERLQLMYLAMLDKLMGFCEERRFYEQGLCYGEQALRCDITNERIHRRMMRLHHLGGNRAAALQQYERCVSLLRDELEVAPSSTTTQLFQQVQREPADSSLPGEEGRQRRPGQLSPALLLSDMRERLSQLADAVAAVQARIHEELLAVDDVIADLRRC